MSDKEDEEREEEAEVKDDDDESGDGGSEHSDESSVLGGTPDADFNLKEPLQDFIKVSGNIVRCRYNPDSGEDGKEEPAVKKLKIDEARETSLAQLQSVAKTTEKLQLLGPQRGRPRQQDGDLVKLHCGISQAIGEAMLHRLTVLRVDEFGGCGDPIFGTRYELRRKYRALEHDLFELLTATFLPGGKCGLRKLTLEGGFMSAESFMKFLRVAKPPLESFFCRGCLFHGRNFEPIVKTLKASTTAPKGLLEFEMNAYVGGKDPFGLLADAFPNLQVLRTKRIYGETPPKAALERLKSLVKKKCELPKENQRLEANCEVAGGIVELFMTSDYHDDGYRGQGLFWDELDNTCECMESWKVGVPITKKQVFQFLAECGIGRNDSFEVEPEDDEWQDEEDDLETVAVQLAVDKSPEGLLALKATTLSGREVAVMSAIDPATTLVRTVMEEIAQKYPCNCLALRLALPDSTTVDVVSKSSETLASILK